MKTVFNNKYVVSFSFDSWKELSSFVNNQGDVINLVIDESYGDKYYCYVCYDSLTSEKQFIISFSSDEKDNNLMFMYWNIKNIFIIYTGKYVNIINFNLEILASFDITTPLIGLYLTNENNLLILEEASFRLIKPGGQILKHELFNAIENFYIKDMKLYIKTDFENKFFLLQ